MSRHNGLRQNLHAYIKRYYLSQIISGLIMTVLITGMTWLLLVLFEYLWSFGTTARTLLFYSFMAALLATLATLLVLPVLRMVGLLKPKTEREAAREIGNKMTTVEDKLVNYLELELASIEKSDGLLKAAVEQKSSTLNSFSFENLVDLRKSFTIAKYLVIPMLIVLLFWLIDPNMLPESSNRMLHYSDTFIPRAPFKFLLENKARDIKEGDPLQIKLKLVGNSIPDNAFIKIDDEKFRMKKLNQDAYEFQLDQISKSLNIQFEAAGYLSEEFHFEIIRAPKLIRNQAYLTYPEYTGLENEKLINRQQIKIPEGTKINWEFEAKNAVKGQAYYNNDRIELNVSRFLAVLDQTIRNSAPLTLIFSNTDNLSDTSQINVFVIKDEFPTINAQEFVDSTSSGIKFFNGEALDDYGLSKLYFIVNKITPGGQISISKTPVDIPKLVRTTRFNFLFPFDSIQVEKGEHLEYFFQVWDNDAVNGSKFSNSTIWTYQPPSPEELRQRAHKQDEESKASLEDELKDLKEAQKDIDQLKKELMQKKKPDWQDKERLKRILEDQQKAMERLMDEALKQRNITEQNNRKSEYSEQLLEKQERIQEMFEKLFDEEYKKKFEEYQELLDELSKQQFMQKLDEMQLDNESLEKEMDRTLELFKQLEFEKKLEENIEKVDELIEEQKQLIDETDQKSSNSKELNQKQNELNSEMEQLIKDLNEMREMNEALEEKNELADTKPEESEAKENMDNASDDLKENAKKEANEHQKNAKKAMEKLSDKMKSMQSEMEAESQGENLENMRQLLENLVDLSIDQEDVMEKLKATRTNDPKYIELAKNEKAIIDDAVIVEDSLLALSKRVPQLDKIINEEISKSKYSMSKSLEHMTNQPPHQEEQYRQYAIVDQQLAMTSLNNLAVIFDEAIRQMQQQMQSQMKGSGKCQKPGNGQSGKPSMSKAMKQQEQLNKQIEEMRKALEKGKNPGGQPPGSMPGKSSQTGISKELARMAAEQSAIREQLRALENEINSKNGKYGQELKELEKMMEGTEEEIIYQKITQQTLERQQEIMTKLLESEKAQRERDMENRRESESALNHFQIPEELLEKFKQQKVNEVEMYRTLPPNLKPFYRNEVNRYFSKFAE